MADLGRRVRVGHTHEPLPVPQFVPQKKEVATPERELVPVGPAKKEN